MGMDLKNPGREYVRVKKFGAILWTDQNVLFYPRVAKIAYASLFTCCIIA